MNNFLHTYNEQLRQKNIPLNVNDTSTILSAVVQQLRNQSTNNRLCCDNNENDLVVRDVDEFGFVTEVRCKKCQKTMQTPFLYTYKEKLRAENIMTLAFEELPTVLSAVVQQLQNQSINNRLCCDNNVNDLVVTGVDRFGFVTEVRCNRCQQTRQAPFLYTYKEQLRAKNIMTMTFKDLPTVLSAVVLLLRRHSINNRLCCGNEDDLEVTDVDSFGFVTMLKCMQCNKMMKTTCHNNAKWTNEKIDDVSQLKPGDHICWHRPYGIWHHGIITTTEPGINVIHYWDLIVKETTMTEAKCKSACARYACMPSSCCDNLYRINYQDCYETDYTIFRARKLLDENRYNLLKRNCEHFSCWCKTGSTNSSQVHNCCASIGKVVLTISLRLIALVILGLLAYSYDAVEEQVKDRRKLETLETSLTILYVTIIIIMFITYLLVTSCSQLHPVRIKNHNIGDPGMLSNSYNKLTRDSSCCRKICFPICSVITMVSLVCQAAYNLCVCKHCQRSPSTCCRRPCKLACGLFWRIIIREGLAATGILTVMLFEKRITNADFLVQKSAIERTAALVGFSVLAQIVGYLFGALIGRFIESWCECCRVAPTDNDNHNDDDRRILVEHNANDRCILLEHY